MKNAAQNAFMKVFATHKNGEMHQYGVFGDSAKIFAYIEAYKGNDLGNDLICQDFVSDMAPTGVIIYPESL